MRELCISLRFWVEPIAGFITAAAVVLVAYVIAPRAKIICACIVFILGAYVAWHTTSSYYPEGHRKAYQHTEIPLSATLAGGIVMLLATMLHRRIKLPNKRDGVNVQERATHR